MPDADDADLLLAQVPADGSAIVSQCLRDTVMSKSHGGKGRVPHVVTFVEGSP